MLTRIYELLCRGWLFFCVILLAGGVVYGGLIGLETTIAPDNYVKGGGNPTGDTVLDAGDVAAMMLANAGRQEEMNIELFENMTATAEALEEKVDTANLILVSTVWAQLLACEEMSCIQALIGVQPDGTITPTDTDPLARDSNLKALWLAENDATDDVGTNDLTVRGTTYTTTSPLQGTYSFYSDNDNNTLYIDDASLSGINLSASFTVGFRANVTSDAADAKLFSKWDGTTNNREFDITRESTDDSIVVSVSSDGGSTNRVDLTAGAGSWPVDTVMTLVVQHNAATHELKLFKNGIEVTTGDFPYTLAWVPFPSGVAPLSIMGNYADLTRGAIGTMDEAWFSTALLSDADILRWHNYHWGN